MLSLPTCDLLSAHLGVSEYLQAGIWLKRDSFDRQLNGDLFLYSLCSAMKLNISVLSYSIMGGTAAGAMEGDWVVFDDG